MSKIFFLILLICFNLSAKEVSIDALAKISEISENSNEEQLLTLNAYRQAVTAGLEDLKLNSELFWSKLDLKKLSMSDEIDFLKPLFSNAQLARPATIDAQTKIPATQDSPKLKSEIISGQFKAEFDLEKLKQSYNEVVLDLMATKLKSFYFLIDIDIDSSLEWKDLGVSSASNFTSPIIDSWKKLVEKDFKIFEKVVVLEQDLENKPEYMNPKSVTLKWKSRFKKISFNEENKTASYELIAQYLLVNTKNGQVLSSFDFPTQKKIDLDTQNKKSLSSTLASLVFNLLNAQSSKLVSLLELDSKTLEATNLDIKITTKTSLSEIYQINNLLQDKFKEIKLTSQMKSYSTDESILHIRAEGTLEKVLASLSSEGGKFALNEQKVLLFNPDSKSFAIVPKE